ncbi:MAG: sensor histidine kinase [Phycisphaerae bacterium]
MRKHSERTILALMILLSILLTGLTVWAVSQQSIAMQQRELDALQNAANKAVTQKEAQLERDLSATFDTAGFAAAVGQTGINYWAASQSRWPYIYYRSGPQDWQRIPPPGTQPPPVFGSTAKEATPRTADAPSQENRGAIEAALAQLPHAVSSEEGRLLFTYLPAPRIMLIRRSIGETAQLVLAANLDDLLTRYAEFGDNAAWRIAPRERPADVETLAAFGPPLANTELIAAPGTHQRLADLRTERLRFVLATAAGTIAAWGLLLYLVFRLLRSQKEVVKLQRRIVADISHELKTPLALIRLHAETLREQRIRDVSRQMEYLDTITRESERLTILLDSILDFSRIERGTRSYNFERCDIRKIARRAWALYEPQFEVAGFDAAYECNVSDPLLHGDADALQQVIVNLLQNAYRYSGEKKWVRLRVRSEGYLIIIEVEDRGIGMSQDVLNDLGASFVRGQDPRVRETRGTGLGLAIVNHTITEHKGKLEAESKPGRGSKFTVWLPCDAQTKTMSNAAAKQQQT